MIQNLIKKKLHDTYHENLPNSLYLNAYELASSFGGAVQDWKNYLKDPETQRFVESEVASLAEVAARRALQNLSQGTANSADISAAKELLANSKLLKQKLNQRQHIFISYLPNKEG